MNQKEMLEKLAEMKNGFDGLISRFNTAQETIMELKIQGNRNFKQKHKVKKERKHSETFKNCGTISKGIHLMRMLEERMLQKKYLK